MVATKVTTPEARQRLFVRLYELTFPPVARFISGRGGSLEEAKDVFQDALVIYYERLVSPTSVLPDHEVAYLLGISRHLWLKRYSAQTQKVSLEAIKSAATPDEELPSSPKLLRFLASAGQKCMNLLKAFYYDHVPLDELADQFGFSGVRSATVQKYKCLEKVRAAVKEKSLQYEDFLDEN